MRPLNPCLLLAHGIHNNGPAFDDSLPIIQLSTYSLANAIGVPPNRITAIIKGQRGITGDTVVRLSEFFGNTAKFWMNLQASYDLRMAEKSMSKQVLKHIHEQREILVTV